MLRFKETNMLTNSVVFGIALPIVGNGHDSTKLWLDKFAATQGLYPPKVPVRSYQDVSEAWKEFGRATDVFYLDMAKLLQADFGCKIVEFGDTWNRQYFLQAAESANPPDNDREDYLVPIDLASLQSADTTSVDANIRRFCEALKVEYTQPRWYVLREWNQD
jgi:hypothetical protein